MTHTKVAGLREQRTSKQTGTTVSLYDGIAADMDTEGGRWQTVCEDHGSICSHESLKQARAWMADVAMWCEDCREALAANNNGQDPAQCQHLSRHEDRHLGSDRNTLCGIPFTKLPNDAPIYDERDGFAMVLDVGKAVCLACQTERDRRWSGSVAP